MSKQKLDTINMAVSRKNHNIFSSLCRKDQSFDDLFTEILQIPEVFERLRVNLNLNYMEANKTK